MKINIPEIDQFKVNGVNIVHIPNNLPIAYVGVFSTAGAYREDKEQEGYSHFIEHMFFKGTTKRTYKDIVQEAVLMSADQNAYTSTYNVLYHLTLPYKNIEKGIELLFDMYFNSTFPEEELQKEKGVVLEEIKMYEDDHGSAFDQWCGDKLFDRMVGHSVVGPQKNIRNLTRNSIMSFKNKYYGLDNTYVLIVGPIKKDKIVSIVKGLKKSYTGATRDVSTVSLPPVTFNGSRKPITKKRPGIQQTYLAMFLPGPEYGKLTQAHRCALNILGGGMHSILFDKVREQLGLCYSINAGIADINNRQSTIQINTLTEKDDEALEAITSVLRYTVRNGIDKKILECAKADLVGDFYRSLSSSGALANKLRNDLCFSASISKTKFKESLRDIESLDIDIVTTAFLDIFNEQAIDSRTIAKMIPA